MDNDTMQARRKQWQRMYEEDLELFGAKHPATEMDAMMMRYYNDLMGGTRQQSARLASEARRLDADDNGPARIHGEM